MDLLMFSGSLREASLNKKLILVAQKILSGSLNINCEIVDLKTLSIPLYDGDVETLGIPSGVKHLASLIQKSAGLIISSPEYNGAISGVLKNVIDWVSRVRPVPFQKKPVLLMGASPGSFGSIRALGNSRAPFESLGSFVYPQSFALPKAHEAFSDKEELVSLDTQKKLTELLNEYCQFVEKFE